MKTNANNSFWKRFHTLAFAASILLGSMSLAHAARTVTLGWDADTNSQAAGVVGYRLYYGTASANYSQMLDVSSLTTATISNLVAGSTYYFVVTGYNAEGVESLPSNEISFDVAPDATPVVNLTSPGNMLNGPATVTLTASASVEDAAIVKVEFYAGSTKVGEARTSPYTAVWDNAQPGNYQLSAVAYDSNGTVALSAPVPVNIVAFGVTKLEPAANGGCQLTATGAPGSTYNVLISEDLVNWRVLKTVTNTGGTVTISDETASQAPQRFYKLAVN